MKRVLKRSLSMLLAVIMMLSALPLTGGVAAADETEQKRVTETEATVSVQNGFVQVTVNRNNGRFMVRTLDGQPMRKGDQNSLLTFEGDDTSFTTFRINGTDYIFGNGYDITLNDGSTIKSELGEIVIPETEEDGTQKIYIPWTLNLPTGKIIITEMIRLVDDTNTKEAGMADISYTVQNFSGATVTMASRLLLDNMLGTNDGPSYQNGTIQENVQTVERSLIRSLKVDGKTTVDGVEITSANRDQYLKCKLVNGDIIYAGATITDENGFDLKSGDKLTFEKAQSRFNKKYYVDGQTIVDGTIITEENRNYYNLSSYYMMRDYGSYLDSANTNVYAYGFLNIAASNEDPNLVDKVIVGHWNHLANSKFDVQVNPNLDFTEDTNDYGTGDTGTAYYWNNRDLENNGVRIYRVLYGVGEIINDFHYLDVTFVDQINQLQTNDAQTEYLDDGVFEITVQVQVPEYMNEEEYKLAPKEHEYITCSLSLEDNLDFVVTSNGQPTYNADGSVAVTGERTQKKTYTKSVTDLSNPDAVNYFTVGDICNFRFLVKATGKAWPATREYLVTVTSPQLTQYYEDQTKAAESGDDSFTLPFSSSYNEIRSDFILLPAIGNMVPTTPFSFSPEMAYYKDKKIVVTTGINNIGAYSVGNDYVGPNFRAFLVNTMTGDRYEANVQRDVMVIDRDGVNGTLRIGYRGGVRVDEKGNPLNSDGTPYEYKGTTAEEKEKELAKLFADATNPELPLGTYAVQVIFNGTAEMKQEEKDLLCFTTEQVVDVSDDPRARIRTGGVLLITRRYYTLTESEYQVYKMYMDGLNTAAKLLDGEDAYVIEYQTGSTHYVPYYEYKLFENDVEVETYKTTLNLYEGSTAKKKTGKTDVELLDEWHNRDGSDGSRIDKKNVNAGKYDDGSLPGAQDALSQRTGEEEPGLIDQIKDIFSGDDEGSKQKSNSETGWSAAATWNKDEIILQITGNVEEQDGQISVSATGDEILINGIVKYSSTKDLILNVDGFCSAFWNKGAQYLMKLNYDRYSYKGATTPLNSSYMEMHKGDLTKTLNQAYYLLYNGYLSHDGEFGIDYDAPEPVFTYLPAATDKHLNYISVVGKGKLSCSTFTILDGEFSIDFFDGVAKTLCLLDDLTQEMDDVDYTADENIYSLDSVCPRGNYYEYTHGYAYDKTNPLDVMAEPDVYINRLSQQAQVRMDIEIYTVTVTQYRFFMSDSRWLLNVSGSLDLGILHANANNIFFDNEGFYGMDCSVGLDLWKDIGILKKIAKTFLTPSAKSKNHGAAAHKPIEAGFGFLTRYYREGAGEDYYAIYLNLSAPFIGGFGFGIGLKQIAGKKTVMPDSIVGYFRIPSSKISGLGGKLAARASSKPVAPPLVFVREIRIAIRNLVSMGNTIKNGGKFYDVPLTIGAGVSLEVEVPSAWPCLWGNIDATIKATGIKVCGNLDLDFAVYGLALINYAVIELYWAPSFYLNAEVLIDIGNFGIVVGEGHLFLYVPYDNPDDWNMDFLLAAEIKLPDWIPGIGGLTLAKVGFGVGKERIYAALGYAGLCINVAYYWGDGVDIWMDSEGNPTNNAMYYVVMTDEESGVQNAIGVGGNWKVLASSYIRNPEDIASEEIIQRSMEGGLSLLEYRSNLVGTGGIDIKQDGGKYTYTIPVADFTSGVNEPADALIQYEYFDTAKPGLTMTGITKSGKSVPCTFEIIDPVKGDVGSGDPYLNRMFYQELTTEGVTQHRGYFTATLEQLNNKNDASDPIVSLELVSDQQLDVTLMSSARVAEMPKDSVKAVQSGKTLTFSADVNYAKEGDIVTFYLTDDSTEPAEPTVGAQNDTDETNSTFNTEMVLGIAEVKDGKATLVIDDYTDCNIMGKKGTDLNEILSSGTYYVLGQLKSQYGVVNRLVKDANGKALSLKLEDPLAPKPVTEAYLEPDGNQYFTMQFKMDEASDLYPAEPKEGDTVTFEGENVANYVSMDFYDVTGTSYDNYCDVLISRETMIYSEELGMFKNSNGNLTYDPETKVYTAMVGGMAELTSYTYDDDGNPIESTRPFGLETEKYYSATIRTLYQLETQSESSDSTTAEYHASAAVTAQAKNPIDTKTAPNGTVCQLLPEPEFASCVSINGIAPEGEEFETITNKTVPELTIVTDKACSHIQFWNGDEMVLDYYGEDGKGVEANTPYTVTLDELEGWEGVLALDMVMYNRRTRDQSMLTVRITCDTTPPVLYVNGPLPGDLTEKGQVRFYGVTDMATNKLTVYQDDSTTGTELTVDATGQYSGMVTITGDQPTVTLRLHAVDLAGNESEAEVKVNNSNYVIVQSIVTRSVKLAEPYYSTTLETVARIATGKDSEGNVLYREELLSNDDVTYSIYKGNSTVLSEDGTIEAVKEGSTIVKASFTTLDGRELSTSTVVTCPSYDASKKQEPSPSPTPTAEPTSSPTAEPTAGPTSEPTPSSKPTNRPGEDSGNTGDHGGSTGDGGSTGGDTGSTGKTDDKDKENATTVSKDESKTTVNKEAVEITITDGIVSIDATGEAETQTVTSKQNAVGFEITYTAGADLSVDTPLFKAELPAEILGEGGTITVTTVEDAKPANGDLKSAVSLNLGDAGNLSEPVVVSVSIPDDVAISEITAVLLRDKDGNVTPLPYQLNMIGDKAFIDVQLSDEGTILFENCQTAFTDVSASDWSYAEIKSAAALELIQGMGNNKYAPKDYITRSAFATILLRTAGLMTQDSDTKLKDVKEDAWDYSALAIASDFGVMTGDGNGNMNGSDNVTREQAMTMVGRFLRSMGIAEELDAYEGTEILYSFEDGDTLSSWAIKDAALCIKYGVIKGVNGTNGYMLDGKGLLTREQCAAIANRVYALVVANMK